MNFPQCVYAQRTVPAGECGKQRLGPPTAGENQDRPVMKRDS